MNTVANWVIELTPNGIIDRLSTVEEYFEDERIKALREEKYGDRLYAAPDQIGVW